MAACGWPPPPDFRTPLLGAGRDRPSCGPARDSTPATLVRRPNCSASSNRRGHLTPLATWNQVPECRSNNLRAMAAVVQRRCMAHQPNHKLAARHEAFRRHPRRELLSRHKVGVRFRRIEWPTQSPIEHAIESKGTREDCPSVVINHREHLLLAGIDPQECSALWK